MAEGLEDRRMLSAGTLDSSFGLSGIVTTDVSIAWEDAEAVLVQNDGKIVVVGVADSGPGVSDNFLLIRYNADGTPDTGFGVAGVVTTDFFGGSDVSVDAQLQNDGKIVAVGEVHTGTSTGTDFGVARYNPDGTLDSTFGSGGHITTDFFSGAGLGDHANALAIQPDGKIMVAGGATDLTGARDIALARYNSDGSLDSSFGSSGILTVDLGASGDEFARDIAIQSDGKLIVTGGGGGTADFLTVRFNSDGSLDSSFGTGGIVSTDFGSTWDYAQSIAVQPDGRIIVAGYTQSTSLDWALVRYNSDGSLDASFGQAGKVTTDFSGRYDYLEAGIVLQTDGKIIAGGTANGDFAIARYNANGVLDDSFGAGGKVTTDLASGSSDFALGIAIQSDGKIVIAGGTTIAGNDLVALARYDGDAEPVPENPVQAWIEQFGSSDFDFVQSATDSDGCVYVAGEVGPSGVLPGQTNLGGGDSFVQKLDAAGNVLWTRQFGTSGNEQSLEVAADSSGVYVVGSTSGVFAGESSFGEQDAFIVKYDHLGNLLWQKQFGTAGTDFAMSITTDGTSIYIAGTASDVFPGQTSSGAYIAKFDLSGNPLWTEPFLQFGSSPYYRPWGITVQGSDLYITGEIYGDGFVAKFNTSGVIDWTKQYGTSGVEQFFDVTADSSGVYISGVTSGAFPGENNLGDYDAIVLMIDATGTIQWTNQFGTSGYDEAFAIRSNNSGLYVGGYIDGVLPGQTSAGSADLFVRKLDKSGDLVWTKQFGTSDYDYALGLAVDGANIYLAGGTSGTFAGESNAGLDDAFVAKFVEAITPDMLDDVIVDTPLGGEFNAIADPSDVDAWILAIGGDGSPENPGLPPNTDAFDGEGHEIPGNFITIVLTLAEGEYGSTRTLDVPPGYTLVLQGQSGVIDIVGSSPAMVFHSGNIIVRDGIRFSNDTDFPTIVVDGAHVTFRNCVISESTSGDQAAIEILGGTVDLGTATDPGGNTLVVNGVGQYIDNRTITAMLTLGNIYEGDGVPVFGAADPVVFGTPASDDVDFRAGNAPGETVIVVNGLSTQTIVGADHLVAYGNDGDDTLQVTGSIELPVWFYGQGGNDNIRGGAGPDMIDGGSGDDLIVGKGGRDLLIGGLGADRIVGNADDDILIAGLAHFNAAKADAVMERWLGSDEALLRKQAIEAYLADQAVVVSDDDARDMLTGSSGVDWFLANLTGDGALDKVTDLDDTVFATDLGFILAS